MKIRPWPLALILAACGTDGGPDVVPTTHTTTDSAGVTIVANSAAQWSGDDRWRVLDTPLLSLGDAEANADEAFDQIGEVVQRDDGRVVVLDRRARK